MILSLILKDTMTDLLMSIDCRLCLRCVLSTGGQLWTRVCSCSKEADRPWWTSTVTHASYKENQVSDDTDQLPVYFRVGVQHRALSRQHVSPSPKSAFLCLRNILLVHLVISWLSHWQLFYATHNNPSWSPEVTVWVGLPSARMFTRASATGPQWLALQKAISCTRKSLDTLKYLCIYFSFDLEKGVSLSLLCMWGKCVCLRSYSMWVTQTQNCWLLVQCPFQNILLGEGTPLNQHVFL